MMQNVYKVEKPQGNPLPLIFDSPHSGREYPADFGYACPFGALQGAEDSYVDDLFASAPDHGATLLLALFPRTYIDVNRREDDIDPDLLAEPWPHPTNPSPRSHAGIGLIRRLIHPGEPIYNQKFHVKQIQHRIDNYYKPYHFVLCGLIDDAHYRFGQAWHINCHSMPSAGAVAASSALQILPDFVLGDRDGTTCDPNFIHALRDFLKGLGYRVAINHPYKGVELIRRYSDPNAGRHSVQIEINKALYWDEKSNEKGKNYNTLKSDIEKFIEFCARHASENLVNLAAD